jgi:E3 ubiquitin-protein ligase UBR4
MMNNLYSSEDPSMGPLMRDVKEKISQDCELVALPEDENGMELLVANKIINLNISVRDVYKKVWLPSLPPVLLLLQLPRNNRRCMSSIE